MVQSKSNSRLSPISRAVVLTQTDTTVGFVSQNQKKLHTIKSRDLAKPFLKVYVDFKTLLESSIRVPSKHKNYLRRSKKTTFVVKNQAFRISKHLSQSQVLRNLVWTYSTSANENSKSFVFNFCEDKADIIVKNKNGLHEKSSSHLIKIGTEKKVRLR